MNKSVEITEADLRLMRYVASDIHFLLRTLDRPVGPALSLGVHAIFGTRADGLRKLADRLDTPPEHAREKESS